MLTPFVEAKKKTALIVMGNHHLTKRQNKISFNIKLFANTNIYSDFTIFYVYSNRKSLFSPQKKLLCYCDLLFERKMVVSAGATSRTKVKSLKCFEKYHIKSLVCVCIYCAELVSIVQPENLSQICTMWRKWSSFWKESYEKERHIFSPVVIGLYVWI